MFHKGACYIKCIRSYYIAAVSDLRSSGSIGEVVDFIVTRPMAVRWNLSDSSTGNLKNVEFYAIQ